jgi:hypothetical protein
MIGDYCGANAPRGVVDCCRLRRTAAPLDQVPVQKSRALLLADYDRPQPASDMRIVPSEFVRSCFGTNPEIRNRPMRTAKTKKRSASKLRLVWSAAERRGAIRFPVTLPLCYRLGSLDTQPGRTLDISRSGVRFTTMKPLAEGANIELSVSWPAPFHGTAPATLMLFGIVVRSAWDETAAKIKRAEFRAAAILF